MVYKKISSSTSVLPDASKSQPVDQFVNKPAIAENKNGNNGASYSSMPSPAPAFAPRYQDQATPTQEVSGILDIQPEGHGFLRPKFIQSSRDIYISQSQIRR